MPEPTPSNSAESPSPIENTYQSLLADRQRQQEAFARRLEPSPESEKFKAEIVNPAYIEDSETGIKYATYRLNRDKEGVPLVVNLAWSCGAESGVGRADLNELAAHIDRPIITIDMEATGKTGIPDRATRKAATFESLAASHLRVIDTLGIDKFDISGYSLGGVMAAGIAAQAGDRVGRLITIASPGFEDIGLIKLANGFVLQEGKSAKEYRQDASETRPTISAQDEAAQAATSGTINRRNIPTLLKLAKLMTQEATAQAIDQLNPSTKWTDVVGSGDAVTDWTGHLKAVRERNSRNPHSATEHLLGSETHRVGIHRPAMAEVVAATLARETSK